MKLDATSLAEQLATTGGFSVDAQGNSPRFGYMVSLPHREIVTTYNPKTAAAIIETHRPTDLQAGQFYGGWIDGNLLYLDVSVNLTHFTQALWLAEQYEQLAIYDVAESCTVYLADILHVIHHYKRKQFQETFNVQP